MTRKYDASRREAAAQKTREQILDAAFKLHGQGIVDFESLALEANVSLATVRKHFPNREILFENCTAWGLHYAAMPDMEQLAATADPEERFRLTVQQLYGLYESLFGQLWMSYLHQGESAVAARVLTELEGFVGQVIDLALSLWAASQSTTRLVTGLLGFLTYRSLRHAGGLSQDEATTQITSILLSHLKARGLETEKEVVTA